MTKNHNFNWSEKKEFDYDLVADPEHNKSHLEKRKELIREGKVECSEWWLCSRKH